jgi:phenylacetate-CoA ligase
VVAALRHGAALERRFAAWLCGHGAGCQVVQPAPGVALIDKSTLRARPGDFIGPAARGVEALFVKNTSGTTGRPVPILFDELSAYEHAVVASRRIAALHAPLVDPPTPGPFVTLAATEASDLAEEIWVDPWCGFVVQVVVDEADPGTFRRLVALARELRPDVLTLKPTLLTTLFEYQPLPGLLAGAVGLVAVSGSDFGPQARERSEERLGVPVSEAYGLTEFGLVAAECGARAGLHVDPEVLPEILDHDTGSLLPASDLPLTGELVLTGARNTAYPLTRYRTGDLTTLTGGACVCGRRTPRLSDLSGRLVRNFRLPGGGILSPARFNGLFERHPLAEFQLVQRETGSFLLHAEPQPGTQLDALALETDVRALIGPQAVAAISIGPVQRAGKFQRYVCEVF